MREHWERGCATTASDATSAYSDKALAEESRAVANALEGQRNDQLKRSAFSLFQLVAGGVLPDGEVREALMGRRAGWLALTAAEAGSTINSARSAGLSEPRGPKQRESLGVKRLPKLTPDRRPILTPLCNARRSALAGRSWSGLRSPASADRLGDDGVIRRGS